MMSPHRTMPDDDRRGATLVLVALSMFLLLGIAALAVDMSAAFAWRTETQKIADASALAGASAFLDFSAATAQQPAVDRAVEYALMHDVKGDPIDSSEVTVVVIPDSFKVRVGINRPGMPVWFARILGVGSVDIGAVAAAQAQSADAARCLKPFAVPDAWSDFDQDTNGNRLWDPSEKWEFGSSPQDRYQRYDGPADPNATNATGYGSGYRDGTEDWGRQIQLKATDPQNNFNFEPGIFFPWRLPADPNAAQCTGGGGGSAGGAVYRNNICTCNTSRIDLFQPYDLEPGNMVGPTFQGVGELIAQDPTAYWEPSANGGRGGVARPNAASPNGWMQVGVASPRVVKLALFDPTQITGPGMQSIEFNNFALMFLEAQPTPASPVRGRFMYFAGGESTGGPNQGSLVMYLRLVQ